MIHRAYALSSTTKAFNEECIKLRSIVTSLDYPINSIFDTVTCVPYNMLYYRIFSSLTVIFFVLTCSE